MNFVNKLVYSVLMGFLTVFACFLVIFWLREQLDLDTGSEETVSRGISPQSTPSSCSPIEQPSRI